MKFMKSRSITQSSKNDNNMIMSMNKVIYNKSGVTHTTSHKLTVKPKDPPTRLEWGTSIWLLFHTLAHKIKDEYYDSKSNELFTIIKSISANLPCPICSEHATKYLGSINHLSLKKKEDMKLMLFQFHNSVNERKGHNNFALAELESKYNNAVTLEIINNFIISFSKKSRNIQLIANEMSKKRVLTNVINWLRDNIHIFEK